MSSSKQKKDTQELSKTSKHDLEHSQEDWHTVQDLLDEEESSHEFTNEEVLKFAEASGDDQDIHVNDNRYALSRFHRKTEDLLNEENKENSNIVHGVLTLSYPISNMDSDLKRNPSKLSAVCPNPVYHSSEESESINWSYNNQVNVSTPERDKDVAYITIEEFNQDINPEYDFMMYAVSKGMGFDDRTGDVLLGFPEIEFTDASADETSELYNLRSLKREEDAEKIGLDHIGDVEVYENTIVNQNAEPVVSYDERILDIENYPSDNIASTFTDTYISGLESARDVGEAFNQLFGREDK